MEDYHDSLLVQLHRLSATRKKYFFEFLFHNEECIVLGDQNNRGKKK